MDDHRTFVTQGPGVPATTAPISQAVVAGNYCHISGQLAVDATGTFVGGTIHQQAELAFANLFAVLQAAGFQQEEIVFVDLAFTDLGDLPLITPFYDNLFAQGRKPARTVYQAAALPAGAKFKVMAVAIRT
jgi:2-iminobutanoate/2-iminopropanoate deaminase